MTLYWPSHSSHNPRAHFLYIQEIFGHLPCYLATWLTAWMPHPFFPNPSRTPLVFPLMCTRLFAHVLNSPPPHAGIPGQCALLGRTHGDTACGRARGRRGPGVLPLLLPWPPPGSRVYRGPLNYGASHPPCCCLCLGFHLSQSQRQQRTSATSNCQPCCLCLDIINGLSVTEPAGAH